jgi:hypothetical protein
MPTERCYKDWPRRRRKLDACNLVSSLNGDPTPTVGKDGAPLVAGDYFMWGNPTTVSALPFNARKVLSIFI